MFKQLPSLQMLIRQLQRLPYLASKNIYRVAIHFLKSDEKQIDQLCQAIDSARKNVKKCSVCCNWTEDSGVCSICSSSKRDQTLICVVESWYDLFAIERAGGYTGVYHVLGGVLSPMDGVGVEDLSIESLLKRLDGEVVEVIFATNPTPEGEATASFISSKLDRSKIKISRLASGIPIGSSLEYMDRVTVYKALSGRRPF